MNYVRQQRPNVVLMENVRGLMSVSQKLSTTTEAVRNVDHVWHALSSCGYTCGHTVVDARRYLLPQTRARVWIWAERDGGQEAELEWPRLLKQMESNSPFSLEMLLAQ